MCFYCHFSEHLGAYFTAVDLAQFAYQLDEQELSTMVEGAGITDDIKRFTEVLSLNDRPSVVFIRISTAIHVHIPE